MGARTASLQPVPESTLSRGLSYIKTWAVDVVVVVVIVAVAGGHVERRIDHGTGQTKPRVAGRPNHSKRLALATTTKNELVPPSRLETRTRSTRSHDEFQTAEEHYFSSNSVYAFCPRCTFVCFYSTISRVILVSTVALSCLGDRI